MDEDQYRSTYHAINPNRCVFEKSMNNRRCDCALKQRFLIATREGVACTSEKAVKKCTLLLNTLRDRSRFVLKVITVDGPMPHNKELRVQAGGMMGLQKLMLKNQGINPQHTPHTVKNIHQVVTATLLKYSNIDNIPYSDVIKDIAACQVRTKRGKR